MQKALDLGLRWTVITYVIEKEFPRLPQIFQRALNVEHHVGEGQSVDVMSNTLSQIQRETEGEAERGRQRD